MMHNAQENNKNIKKIKIIKSWVEPTEENSRGDNDSAAIRGDNN